MEFFNANKDILLLILSIFTTVFSIYFIVRMAFKITIGLLSAFSLYLLFFASPEMKQSSIVKWDGVKSALFSSDFVLKHVGNAVESGMVDGASNSIKSKMDAMKSEATNSNR